MRIKNTHLPTAAMLLLLFSLALSNCKKTDQSSPEVQVEETSMRLTNSEFFQYYGTLDAVTAGIRKYVISEDAKYHFSEQYLEKAGKPVWNKALTFTNSSVQTSSSNENEGKSSITYIPFADENKLQVKAALVIKIIGSDTIPAMLYSQQYAKYGFDHKPGQWNARNVFHIFALLDHAVYNTKEFILTDKRLLTEEQKSTIQEAKMEIDKIKVKYTIQETAQQQVSVNTVESVEVCNTFAVCLEYGLLPFKGNASVMSQTAPCIEWGSQILCTTYWFNIPGGGSNGGSNDGGSTGGGSGGGSGGGGNNGGPWAPVPDPCAPPSEAKGTLETLNSEECDPGWYSLWDSQLAAYQNILLPGESFDYNVEITGNFELFNTIADFQAFKDGIGDINNTTYDLSIPPIIISQNEKIKQARYSLNLLGGVDVDVKLEKVDNLWKVKEVESDTWGLMPMVSWKQGLWSADLSGNEITVEVKGKLHYNIVVEGIGTVYKKELRFRIKINNITGELNSISRF